MKKMVFRDPWATKPNYILLGNSRDIQWFTPKPIIKTQEQIDAEKKAYDDYWANYQKPDGATCLLSNRWNKWGYNEND